MSEKDTSKGPETSVVIESGPSALPGSLIKANGDSRETGLSSDHWKFNSERKQRFIDLTRTLWPNMSAVCRGVGITPQTFWFHRKTDLKFSQALEAVKAEKLDELEGIALASAQDMRKGFLDRAMMLRAHRPETFDRAKTIKIQSQQLDTTARQARLQVMESVIDAEIVGTVKGRRTQSKSSSPQKPK